MVVLCNDTATTEIYTLALHDALPIWRRADTCSPVETPALRRPAPETTWAFVTTMPWSRSITSPLPEPESVKMCTVAGIDRKSTRLNSSHANISYAVFCLKNQDRPLDR